jgi:hypothetical protein
MSHALFRETTVHPQFGLPLAALVAPLLLLLRRRRRRRHHVRLNDAVAEAAPEDAEDGSYQRRAAPRHRGEGEVRRQEVRIPLQEVLGQLKVALKVV